MRRIIFIRHGKTWGNLEGRYIGRTDLPLAPFGAKDVKLKKYPQADSVISSPMKRCTETAEIIYPDKEAKIYEDLRECDFGKFENKTHNELKNDPDYINWIKSAGREPVSGGETSTECQARCCDAFLNAVEENEGSLAFIIHGGTIMGILNRFASEKKDFYDWFCENGCGYICDFDEETKVLYVIKKH
ncbi:MAG: histidine phosphatase family protein [Firmicutes bacterium]|nr:histidine phosphatase family protein [Bacillota bacterium]